MSRRFTMVCCVLSFLFAIAGAASATTYTFQDLGLISSGSSYGYGMNASGQVVGIAGATLRPVVYTNGTVSNLNEGTYRIGGYGYGISANGSVAGAVDINTGLYPPQYNPAMWNSSGTLTYIGNLGGTGTGYAYSVTDNGQVVGKAPTASSGTHAFYWTAAGGIVDLGNSYGSSFATWIDQATGHVVGNESYSGGVSAASFFNVNTPGTGTPLANMLGTGGGTAECVNDTDQVVGFFGDGSGTHSYIWNPTGGGVTTDIGARLPVDVFNKAFSVNNHGLVVGQYGASAAATQYAFVYDSATNTAIDLNSATYTGAGLAGFVLNQARAINDNGQITGLGTTAGGAAHAFLLTPVPTPEPSSLLLAASGLVGLLAYAWRKRK